ncbi:hypothetical protein CEXT_631171 [Caerostris extrusa]|uniref:Uncharacterized protein n=1 Tax=Caerostris extrusa TaxID=172846 RepID=A0AAV4SFW3_CAEEX|nr:hypothetical protein CEXT_631171 [Caerostris extrusa]
MSALQATAPYPDIPDDNKVKVCENSSPSDLHGKIVEIKEERYLYKEITRNVWKGKDVDLTGCTEWIKMKRREIYTQNT